MQPFTALHGYHPTVLQLIATYGLAIGAAGLTISYLGVEWRAWIIALLAADWVGGTIANSAETVRSWWRARPRLSVGFVAIHIIEWLLLWWLTSGGLMFGLLSLALLAKLSVFMLGQSYFSRRV